MKNGDMLRKRIQNSQERERIKGTYKSHMLFLYKKKLKFYLDGQYVNKLNYK